MKPTLLRSKAFQCCLSFACAPLRDEVRPRLYCQACRGAMHIGQRNLRILCRGAAPHVQLPAYPRKDRVEHRLSEAAGLRVLATGVIGSDQEHALGKLYGCAMREVRPSSWTR